MIIDIEKVKQALLNGDKNEISERFGIPARTVYSYQRGERDVSGMKLETATHIMQVLLEEQINNSNEAARVRSNTNLVLEADNWYLYQDKDNEEIYTKVMKDDSAAPKEYKLSPVKNSALQIMLNGLRDLQPLGQDLTDSYDFLESDFFP